MCSAIKYPYLPLKGLEFPGGGVFCKITTFEEIYEAWLEFPEGCEVFLEVHSQCKETQGRELKTWIWRMRAIRVKNFSPLDYKFKQQIYP